MLALPRKMASPVNIRHASGTSGAVAGSGLPRGPELRSGAGDAFRPYLEAEAHPGAVKHARRAAGHTLTIWRLGHVADGAELVVNRELVANAVTAAPGTTTAAPVALYLALESGRLFALVRGGFPQPPARRAGYGFRQWLTTQPALAGRLRAPRQPVDDPHAPTRVRPVICAPDRTPGTNPS
jgi:hypothetical protein